MEPLQSKDTGKSRKLKTDVCNANSSDLLLSPFGPLPQSGSLQPTRQLIMLPIHRPTEHQELYWQLLPLCILRSSRPTPWTLYTVLQHSNIWGTQNILRKPCSSQQAWKPPPPVNLCTLFFSALQPQQEKAGNEDRNSYCKPFLRRKPWKGSTP